MRPTGRPPMLSGMTTTVDTQALDQLVGSVFGDFAAAMTLPLVRFGDRFGMYVALRDSGPSTPAELAARCALPAPIVHQWLANQAASGYITVDAEGTTFSLTPEQTAVFADEGSGVCMLAGFQLAAAYTRSEPTLAASLRNGTPTHGATTIPSCSRRWSASTVRRTRARWSRSGSRRWTASATRFARVRRSPTSAAGTGCPPW